MVFLPDPIEPPVELITTPTDWRENNNRVHVNWNYSSGINNLQSRRDNISSAGVPGDFTNTGTTWSRYEIKWQSVMTSMNVYNGFGPHDINVNLLRGQDLAICCILDYGHSLVTGSPDWQSPPRTAYQIEKWCQYAETTVARYKDQIKYWEIWNEPDIGFWPGDSQTQKAEEYTRLLKAAYPRIKAVDPTAQVIGLVLAGPGRTSFVNKVFADGGGPYMDLCSVHSYSIHPNYHTGGPNGPYNLAKFHDALEANGYGDMEIWITEYGATLEWANNDSIRSAGEPWASLYGNGQALQAEAIKWHVKYYLEPNPSSLGWGNITKSLLHYWRDNGPGPYGLAERDGTLRTSYADFQTLATKYNTGAMTPGGEPTTGDMYIRGWYQDDEISCSGNITKMS